MPLFMLYPAALALLTLAERSLGGRVQQGALVATGLMILIAWLRPLWRAGRAQGDHRRAWLKLWRAISISALGVVLHALSSSDAFFDLGEAAPLLTLVSVTLMGWGLLVALAIERALLPAILSPVMHMGRIRQAQRSARMMALTLISFAALNFVAERHSRKVDLSYFHTTRVGDATRNIAHGLHQPVGIVLFFPPGNAAGTAVLDYVKELLPLSPALSLEQYDHALAPERARALGVRHNGTLVLVSGEQRETLSIPLDFEEARGVLRRLDQEISRRLLGVIRPPKILYVTSGHNERDLAPTASDKRPGLSDFRALAENLGFVVRRLGLAEGLGHEVPRDAAVVLIAGPSMDFSASERAALLRYLGAGGRLLAGFDPHEGALEAPLLRPFGLEVMAQWVANNHYMVRVPDGSQSPFNLVTTRISGHPSVRTLERNPGRMGLVLLGTAPIVKQAPAPAGLKLVPTVFSMPESWLEAGPRVTSPRPQTPQTATLAMAVEGVLPSDPNQALEPSSSVDGPQAMRAVIVGDVDFISRGIVRNPGNATFVSDGLRWLTGDEAESGATATEEDVPLVHRKEGDAAGFYGVTFGVPLVILAVGLRFGPRRPPRRLGRRSDV